MERSLEHVKTCGRRVCADGDEVPGDGAFRRAESGPAEATTAWVATLRARLSIFMVKELFELFYATMQ